MKPMAGFARSRPAWRPAGQSGCACESSSAPMPDRNREAKDSRLTPARGGPRTNAGVRVGRFNRGRPSVNPDSMV
jgi:hypothetical protein